MFSLNSTYNRYGRQAQYVCVSGHSCLVLLVHPLIEGLYCLYCAALCISLRMSDHRISVIRCWERYHCRLFFPPNKTYNDTQYQSERLVVHRAIVVEPLSKPQLNHNSTKPNQRKFCFYTIIGLHYPIQANLQPKSYTGQY